jgi:hypothetical protein
MFTSTPHTRFILLARIPLHFKSPIILAAHISQLLTIPYSLSFLLDTSPTFGEHRSRIIFGDLIWVVGGASDVAMQGSWPAALLMSPPIDNFIIASVCHHF